MAKEAYSKLVLASTEELTVQKDQPTFQTFLEEVYLPWYKTQVKKSTYENRRTTAKKHFAYFFKKKINEIEAIHVQAWQLKMAEQFNPNYMRIVHGMLAIAFDRAVILGLCEKNPARMVGNIKSKKNESGFLDIRRISESNIPSLQRRLLRTLYVHFLLAFIYDWHENRRSRCTAMGRH